MDLRDPPKSALPIYKDEAASYVRHFLKLACDPENAHRQDLAEMVIFLSLCLAAARQYSNYFNPTEILKVTKSSIQEIKTAPKKIPSKTEEEVQEKSKGVHYALQLRVSEDFLANEELWASDQSTCPRGSEDVHPFCKVIKIKDKSVLVGQSLAHAVEIMETFSLTDKDVENRLQEAYKVVGLSQSSGGISRRCFLYAPHYWEGVDSRENLSKEDQSH